jgi:Na+/proline symporter
MLIDDPSFLTDYIHTFIILVICIFFTIKPFTIPEIGSLGNLYDLVAAAGARNPVPGNHNGTYLTMTSKGVRVTDHS